MICYQNILSLWDGRKSRAAAASVFPSPSKTSSSNKWKPQQKWKQQLSKQNPHTFTFPPRSSLYQLGLSFLHRLKCWRRSGKRSSLSIMRASSGGAGSLARVTRRPSGPSGTVSTMPPHHIHSIHSQFELRTSTRRASRDEETIVFL